MRIRKKDDRTGQKKGNIQGTELQIRSEIEHATEMEIDRLSGVKESCNSKQKTKKN